VSSWIKFRTSLINHPKVVRIACAICAQDVRRMCTAIGAIVQTWAMADAHADGECLPGMSFEALDLLLGLPGFAKAMAEVGWLDERDGSLYLPNYQEHNGNTAKRRAQNNTRMKSVRKVCAKCAQDVRKCVCNLCTKRESKNKNSNPNGLLPLTPTKKSAKFDPVVDIEAPFASKEWAEAWAKWCAHRCELRKPLTRQATESQLAELARMGEERALAAIHHSLRGGWQGIFEPKAEKPEGFGAGYGVRPSATERAAQTAERLISGKSAIANQIFAELQAMEMGQ